METIYINKGLIKGRVETVYKRKLIIHDDKNILGFRFGHMFRVFSTQGDEDLIMLVNSITGLNLTMDNLDELIRIESNGFIYESINNKLVPVTKHIIRDFYSYKHNIDSEFLEYVKEHGNDWYNEPIALDKYRILTSKTNTFTKLKKPVEYLWKK